MVIAGIAVIAGTHAPCVSASALVYQVFGGCGAALLRAGSLPHGSPCLHSWCPHFLPPALPLQGLDLGDLTLTYPPLISAHP